MSVNSFEFELLKKSSGLLARHGFLRSLLGTIICDEAISGISLTIEQQELALQSYKHKYGFKNEHELEQHRLNELLSLRRFEASN